MATCTELVPPPTTPHSAPLAGARAAFCEATSTGRRALLCSLGLLAVACGPNDGMEPTAVFEPTADDTDRPNDDPDACLTEDDGASTGPGRFTPTSFELAPGTDGVTVYHPAELEESSCTFAVVAWGNGTSSTGGEAYPEYHQRLASHGFVVAVAHTNFAANGPVLLDTAARVLALNDERDSVLFDRLRAQYAVIGKSQGAIAAARDVNEDPDAVAAVMVAGAGGVVEKPALFATGDQDFLRMSTLNGYEASKNAAVYAEAAGGVGHLALDDSVAVAQLATSFLRCHVQGDQDACAYVSCAECQVEPWGAYQTK